jgi:Lysophospholipase L1 and related esterases
MGKYKKWAVGISISIMAAVAAGLAITGWQTGWGPFHRLFKGFEDEVAAIEEKYNVQERQHEIIFYGASNFRLWKQMEEDLYEYKVQNHGFGGSTDAMLMEYADRILYPYQPNIVFFQTGSNDYINMRGSDEEKISSCMAYKEQMFMEFHQELPQAKFVVMSGLLLPGRSQYANLTQCVNSELQKLCEKYDYLYFVDASSLTFSEGKYLEELFVSDGIHLNNEGQLLWCENYIRPQIETMVKAFGLENLKRQK